ncbi:MAG: metallophosphoesterase family protein [Phocaeicola sp.]
MKKRTVILLASLWLGMGACNMLNTHPYDTQISGETDINQRNIERIEQALAGKKTFRFAMISDTQRWYNQTQEAVEAINARGDVDFVLHGGDQSDFGATKEFTWMRDIMNQLTMPYVVVIGNHDCLGTGKESFRTIYGETNMAFTAGDMRFVCLNTNALEYDYSEPVPNFTFIENELTSMDPDIKRTAFLMHAAPKTDVFNNNVNNVFQRYINLFPGEIICLNGHTHGLSVTDLFEDGTLYYECPNIKKRIYLLFTVNEEGYSYEAISF